MIKITFKSSDRTRYESLVELHSLLLTLLAVPIGEGNQVRERAGGVLRWRAGSSLACTPFNVFYVLIQIELLLLPFSPYWG